MVQLAFVGCIDQIMLDLDNGRFPLALMWALPEVKQEGGAVVADIHVSFRGGDARIDPRPSEFEVFSPLRPTEVYACNEGPRWCHRLLPFRPPLLVGSERDRS